MGALSREGWARGKSVHPTHPHILEEEALKAEGPDYSPEFSSPECPSQTDLGAPPGSFAVSAPEP